MRLMRSLFLVGSAAALSGALAVSAVTAGATAAPAARPAPVRAQLTASFLSEARAALVKDLNRNHGTAWFVHGRPSTTAGAANSSATCSFNWAGYADVSSAHGALHQGQRGLDRALGDLHGRGPDHLGLGRPGRFLQLDRGAGRHGQPVLRGPGRVLHLVRDVPGWHHRGGYVSRTGRQDQCLGFAQWLGVHPGRDRLDAQRQQLQQERDLRHRPPAWPPVRNGSPNGRRTRSGSRRRHSSAACRSAPPPKLRPAGPALFPATRAPTTT